MNCYSLLNLNVNWHNLPENNFTTARILKQLRTSSCISGDLCWIRNILNTKKKKGQFSMHKHEHEGIILKAYFVLGTVLYIMYTWAQITLISPMRYYFPHLQMGNLKGKLVK